MGIEHLTGLFPTEVSSFDFQVENSGRTVQYKLNAQSLRLFGLHSDVNEAHRKDRARWTLLEENYTMTSEERHENNTRMRRNSHNIPAWYVNGVRLSDEVSIRSAGFSTTGASWSASNMGDTACELTASCVATVLGTPRSWALSIDVASPTEMVARVSARPGPPCAMPETTWRIWVCGLGRGSWGRMNLFPLVEHRCPCERRVGVFLKLQ